MYRINKERAREIAEKLKDGSSLRMLESAELTDPQFHAIREIVERYGSLRQSAFYALGIATVSYMLSARGEIHWAIAARYAESEPLQDLKRFVETSPSVGFNRKARISRIERLNSFYRKFLLNFESYVNDLELLRRDVSRVLNADRNAKTVVFAVKMFYYALKAGGVKVKVPLSIPIPVDRRVCLISLVSGLIEGGEPTLREARSLLSRNPDLVRRAWSLVGRLSCVPPLRMDALLWRLGGIYRGGNVEEAIERAKTFLQPGAVPAVSLLRLLLGAKP